MDFFNVDQLTICDLNLCVDAGSRLQQQFYVQGVQGAPRVLLGQRAALGREYRPGILHIDPGVFAAFRQDLHTRILERPADCYLWQSRVREDLAALRGTCDAFESAWSEGRVDARLWQAMYAGLTTLLAYNVLYELYPETEIQAELARHLRDDALARDLYVAVHHTEELPHYTRVNLGLLDLADAWVARRDTTGHRAFIRDVAFAFDFYMTENELECPETLLSHVQALAERYPDPAALQAAREAVQAGRRVARQEAQRAWSELLGRARGDGGLALLGALALRAALATEEEERHFLQMRVQRSARDLLDHLGLPRTTTSAEELAAALEPVGAA